MRIQWTILALLLSAALALGVPATAIGGVAVQGAGLGTYQSNNGDQVCEGSPFVAQAVYFPDGRGSLHMEFAGSCVGLVGLTAALGGASLDTTRSPPVDLTFFCSGTEAAGMSCESVAGDVVITAEVGPYDGPGSMVSLSTRGNFAFDGSFLAV